MSSSLSSSITFSDMSSINLLCTTSKALFAFELITFLELSISSRKYTYFFLKLDVLIKLNIKTPTVIIDTGINDTQKLTVSNITISKITSDINSNVGII